MLDWRCNAVTRTLVQVAVGYQHCASCMNNHVTYRQSMSLAQHAAQLLQTCASRTRAVHSVITGQQLLAGTHARMDRQLRCVAGAKTLKIAGQILNCSVCWRVSVLESDCASMPYTVCRSLLRGPPTDHNPSLHRTTSQYTLPICCIFARVLTFVEQQLESSDVSFAKKYAGSQLQKVASPHVET